MIVLSVASEDGSNVTAKVSCKSFDEKSKLQALDMVRMLSSLIESLSPGDIDISVDFAPSAIEARGQLRGIYQTK